MITLLEKCWEGRHRQKKGILQTKPAVRPVVLAPKRPQGRRVMHKWVQRKLAAANEAIGKEMM